MTGTAPANTAANRPAEFDARLAAHIPALRKRARMYVAHSQIDDLVQDVMASALENWQGYREGGGFVTWLYWRMRAVMSARRDMASRQKRSCKTVDVSSVVLAVPAQQENIAFAAQVVRKLCRSRGGRMLVRIGSGERQAEVAGKYKLSAQRVQQLVAKARAEISVLS